MATAEEKKRTQEELARIKKAQEAFDWGPEVEVTVRNNEAPGVPIEFNFQGKSFVIQHGETLTLPAIVAEHLASLGYPEYGRELDPKTGNFVSKIVGRVNRFGVTQSSFQPVSGAGQAKQKKAAKEQAA